MRVTTGPGAAELLKEEGQAEASIVEVGDVMLDVALGVQDRLCRPAFHRLGPAKGLCWCARCIAQDSWMTSPMAAALGAMAAWADQHQGTVCFPVHPRTQANLKAFGLVVAKSVSSTPARWAIWTCRRPCFTPIACSRIPEGVQKEAWFQGSGGIVLRDTTEWRELLELGASHLFDPARLLTPEGGGAFDVLLAQDRLPGGDVRIVRRRPGRSPGGGRLEGVDRMSDVDAPPDPPRSFTPRAGPPGTRLHSIGCCPSRWDWTGAGRTTRMRTGPARAFTCSTAWIPACRAWGSRPKGLLAQPGMVSAVPPVTEGADADLFSAVFWMASRMEEHLPDAFPGWTRTL